MENNAISTKLKLLREQHELTIDQLAERSSCSAELITSLEAGSLVPSLTPLLKIARGLGVRLGTFLDDAPQTGPVLTKAAHHENVVRFSGSSSTSGKSTLDFFSLAAGKQDRHMEPFIIEVHPPQTQEPTLSSHEGEELLYVLSGAIEVCYGKETFTVQEGDSIYYDSVIPHEVHAGNNCDAKILAVVYAPA